uniref:Piezo_RRas_bdg domain-containing protein n=3 Tax=Bursaphelenchus xylophilus TaxID=6326 RepID=A0A1I7SK92_BURXY
MAVLKTINGMFVVGTWMIIPIQFLWRYHIFRYGQAPRGRYLYFTLIPALLIYVTGTTIMFTTWGYATDEERVLLRKIVIYNGFKDVQLSEVTGTYSSRMNYKAYDYMVKGIQTISYSISILVDWLMSKHWKLRNINANYRTAKTFNGVKKALRIM